MKNTDVGYMKMLTDLIKGIVKKEIIDSKSPRVLPAKIVSVNGNLADIKLAGDDVIIQNLKIKTHETLNVGDCVYLFLPTGSLTNSWIMTKF